MKTLKKGNTIKKTNLGENSIELFTGDDVISSYDLNRPIKNLFDNQIESKIFQETFLKSLYGKQVGIFSNILEEFSSTNAKAFASYNSDYYFRVPTGALLDRTSSTNPSSKSDYTQDDFYSYGFLNKPNTSLMERQLASLINLDLTEDGNELSIDYNTKTGYYTINTTIDYVTGAQSTSLPAPANYATGTLSFYGTVSTAAGIKLTVNLNGTPYQTATLTTGTTAIQACTAVYSILNVVGVTTNFTLTQPTTTSILITYKTIGTSGNAIACSISKSIGTDSLIVSGPSSYLSGGIDYNAITNVFEAFNAFRTAYSGYDISSKNLESKLNLEPIFNITNIVINTPYYLYLNRSQTKNFVNLSSTVSSVTDASGNFCLATSAPVGTLIIGTILKDINGIFSYTKNPLIISLSGETIYPKNIKATKIEAEEIISTGNLGVAQTNFVNKMSVTARTETFTKIATFNPKQSFGTITVSVKPNDRLAKSGSFTIDINCGEDNEPSIIVEGIVSNKTVDYVRVEVSSDYNTGNIWVRHGNYSHSLEMNLINSFNITLLGGARVKPIPTISTAYVFERYIAVPSESKTTDAFQFSFTNNEIDVINSVTALKAQSGNSLFKVGATGISQVVSYLLNAVAKTAEMKFYPSSTIPLLSIRGANVEISNYDAADTTNNRFIKLYTGPVSPLESLGQDSPAAVGPSIMLDRNTVDITGENIHIWGGTFTVHGDNINFGSANISGKLFVSDSTSALYDGTAYAAKISGGLYTSGNIIANTSIEAKRNIKGTTINSLAINSNAIGFSIAGGSTSRTGTFLSNLTIGASDKVGAISIASNNSTARNISLAGDLIVTNGNFTIAGNALGTTLTIANSSLNFATSLSAAGALLYASSSNVINGLTIGTANTVLLSNGTNPLWNKLPLATHVSGILPVSNGGTGSATAVTNGGIAYGASGKLAWSSAGSNNTVLGIKNGSITWIGTNELSANSADYLTTARYIGGVLFDGSADINLPGVNMPGTVGTSGNAATATYATSAGSATTQLIDKNDTTIATTEFVHSVINSQNLYHYTSKINNLGVDYSYTINGVAISQIILFQGIIYDIDDSGDWSRFLSPANGVYVQLVGLYRKYLDPNGNQGFSSDATEWLSIDKPIISPSTELCRVTYNPGSGATADSIEILWVAIRIS